MAAIKWVKWEKEMKKWLKELMDWQEENPTKNWIEELGSVTTSVDEGGSNPKTPPPPPPLP